MINILWTISLILFITWVIDLVIKIIESLKNIKKLKKQIGENDARLY